MDFLKKGTCVWDVDGLFEERNVCKAQPIASSNLCLTHGIVELLCKE